MERLADRDRDVDAHQVEEGERPHRVVGPERHAAVHVLRAHSGLLHQPHGVEEIRKEQPIDHESGLVGHLDDRLADRFAPVAGTRADLGVGGLWDAELDQIHAHDWVEWMKPEGAIRVLGARGDLIEREGGGGRRQVGAVRRAGDRAEQLDLRLSSSTMASTTRSQAARSATRVVTLICFESAPSTFALSECACSSAFQAEASERASSRTWDAELAQAASPHAIVPLPAIPGRSYVSNSGTGGVCITGAVDGTP